jgi:eukaryotic-like serine/threonine-protein kinase
VHVLTPGSRLGPYEVQALIGQGGMGEVYRATDIRLKRDVALKVLPSTFAADADRLARFEREAQVLASLNHPHIAQIHGLEESDGARALVMELVDGPTLADRIAQGPLPIDEAVNIARQIAEALEAAHEAGIIHRDLKPANIKLRPDGTVKVLDFGLAKALESTSSTALLANSPTFTSPAVTEAGVILGTAAYMSPEQARGKPVERRADMWAFGCVLFEMFTGKAAFGGETVTDVLGAIVRDEPDWNRLPARTPGSVQELLRRCLTKDVRERLRDAGEAGYQLRHLSAGPHQPKRSRLLWPVAGVALAATLGVTPWIVTRNSETPSPPPIRFAINVPTGKPQIEPQPFAASPDGTLLAFIGSEAGIHELYVHSFQTLRVTKIPGTESRPVSGVGAGPFWSPDSRQIGFFADGQLKVAPVADGRVRGLCAIGAALNLVSGTWASETIYFASAGRLFAVPERGGECRRVALQSEGRELQAIRAPWALPDGRHLLVFSQGRIYYADATSGASRFLLESDSNAQYAGGYVWYPRRGILYAQAFDPASGTLSEPPQQVSDVDAGEFWTKARFSVSEHGPLVLREDDPERSVLLWYSETGERLSSFGPTDSHPQNVAFSWDGRMVATSLPSSGGSSHVWTIDVHSGRQTRVTSGEGIAALAIWSPDGAWVAYGLYDRRTTSQHLYRQRTDGVGSSELLYKSVGFNTPTSWSADGRWLFFATEGDIAYLDMHKVGSPPLSYLATPSNEGSAHISPDGRWVAYRSNESGADEIYIRAFPDANRGRWQVSNGGGAQPRWSADGRRLFYLAGATMRVATVGVEGDSLTVVSDAALFTLRERMRSGAWNYDVTADGRFLVNSVVTGVLDNVGVGIANWRALLNPRAH